MTIGEAQSCAAIYATVQAITTDGVLLRLDGENAASAPARRLESYSPSIGERVLALGFAAGPVVLGKIV